MADKDYTSLLGKSAGTSWGEIAGAYLTKGKKKDKKARNILLATLFFNVKEAQMQSRVLKNLKELDESKTIELAKLNKQWEKRTGLQTEYDNIQKNGALDTYKNKIEKDFAEAHVGNKEIINMSSGDVADYKLNWMNTKAKEYEDEFMQRYQGIDKGITVKEEFTKPYMDYYKAQKEKIMNPKNVSLVHNMFSKIGFGNKDEELNAEVEKLEKVRNLNQQRIQGFTQADIKQIKLQKASEDKLLGLKINDADLNTLMSNTSLGDTGLNAGRLRQEVRAEWRKAGKTYEAAVDSIAAIEQGFNVRLNESKLKEAVSRYTSINPKPTDPNELDNWQMGLDAAKRKALEIQDVSADAIYRANQLYNIAADNNLTDKDKQTFINDVLAEDIRKATGAMDLNQIKGEIIKGRMYTVYNNIDDGSALDAINNTELSREKLNYLIELNPDLFNEYNKFENLQDFNSNNNLTETELLTFRNLQKEQYVQNEFELANLFSTDIVTKIKPPF